MKTSFTPFPSEPLKKEEVIDLYMYFKFNYDIKYDALKNTLNDEQNKILMDLDQTITTVNNHLFYTLLKRNVPRETTIRKNSDQ